MSDDRPTPQSDISLMSRAELVAELRAARSRLEGIEGLTRSLTLAAGNVRELEQSDLAPFLENVAEHAMIADADGQPVIWNTAYGEAVERLFGIEMRPGLRPYTLIPTEEGVAFWRDLHGRVLAGERVLDRFEYTGADGRYLALEVSAGPIRDADRVVGFIQFTRDVTDEQLVARHLRESERRFRTIFSYANAIVFIISADGTFLLSEGRGLQALGLEPGQVVGMSALEMYKDYPPIIQGIRQSLAGEPCTITADVGGLIFECYYSPIRDDEDRVSATIGMAIDITERHRLTERIQRTRKLESLVVLAGGIAHDFNNLLVGILGNADLALQCLQADHPARDYVQAIERAGDRAKDLANQMLAYSGRGRFVIEPVDLNLLIEDMVHLLKVSIARNADLLYDFDDDLPAVDADAAQMQQLVINLLTNASEAVGDEQGTIVVMTGVVEAGEQYLAGSILGEDLEAGLYAYIEVSDDGDGMEPGFAEKIFEPFFTTKETGRGLGLAAVLGIVRGHRGCIRVITRPGEGTTVRVLLPTRGEPIRHQEAQGGPITGPVARRGRVLLVDDQEVVREVLAAMLDLLGFEVDAAGDGIEALEVFRDRPDDFDVVVLDMTMPRMGGEQTLRELRRVRPNIKVILTSGYAEQEAVRRFVGQELAGFLQKPFQLGALQALMDRVVPGAGS